jgi:class 3 adenylate cyclase/tetratricopeptide (TPR) repeat protein
VRCEATNPSGTKFCGHCGAPALRRTLGTRGSAADDVSATVAIEHLAPRRDDERRLVTVLFADIAGFTTLADRLEPEQLAEVVDPVLQTMGAVIAAHGGLVAKYAGDAVLAFFGAPAAHEDDALRAVRAALDMRREVAGLARSFPAGAHQLALHIGVNSGHVVAGFVGESESLDYSVLGDAVNVAQRLEAATPRDEIYAGELTSELVRGAFELEEVGPLEVKGKPEPVHTWRVVRELTATHSDAGAAPIFGRAAELAGLAAIVDDLAAGSGRVVAFVGEPGIGKSRLLNQLQNDAADVGVRCAQTRCLSYGTGAYGPYAELLRALTDVGTEDSEVIATWAADATAGAATRGSAPYLQHLLGLQVDGGIPSGILADPEALRRRVNEAVVDFVETLTAEGPLLIAIEDVQWIDAASADLTELLAKRCRTRPVCIALTTRPEGRETIERIADSSGGVSDVVDLTRLEPAAVEALVTDSIGPPDENLLEFVIGRTEGNPLFVQEVVRSLLEGRALARGRSGWYVVDGEAADRVPTTIESVLAARIDMLPRDAAEALLTASVIGQRVPLALLQATVPEESFEAIVDVLIERNFLDRVADGAEPSVSFRHALIVDVAYARLLRQRRREIHRRVGETAIRLYGTGDDVIDLIAHHAYHGELGAEAVPYLERAGRRAAQLFANDDALTALRRAIEVAETLPSPGVLLAQLAAELAQVEERIGAYESALTHYEHARAEANELSSYLGIASTLRKLGRYDECLRVLDEARAAQHGTTPTGQAMLALEQGWVLALRGDYDSSAAVLEAGVAAARGDDELEGQLHVHLARTLEMLDRAEEGLVHAERARRLFAEAENLPQLAVTLRVLGGIQHDLAGDDREQMRQPRETLEQALALARRVGNAEEQAASLINLANVLSHMGELEAAIDADREALAAFQSVGLKAGIACVECNLAEHLDLVGRWEEALEAARRGLAVAEEIGSPYWITGALIGIANTQNALGNSRAAAEAAEASLEQALAHGLTGRGRSAAEAAVEAYEALGDSERADALRGRADALLQR